ncbi:MAG: NAD(P) transhydrogenase [Chlamydiales bacterium]|jgi:NAD(P) transhydrogenase
MDNYDLIVLGCGPAGEKSAVKSAYFGYKVAIIEKSQVLGGAAVHTGTLPSKTLRETALYLSGKYEKGLYSIERKLEEEASIQHFLYRKNQVSSTEAGEIKNNILLHNVDLYTGSACFEDQNTISISSSDGSKKFIRGKFIVISTGSIPYHPPEIPFDGKRIHDSDTILNITRFPKTLCVVGAGVIGCEYSSIFSTMGVKVYLINKYEVILPFLDQEISNSLIDQMKEDKIEMLFNDSVNSVSTPKDDLTPITVSLKSGKKLHVDMFLFASGRVGNLGGLAYKKVGLEVNSRDQISVDETYRTNIPNIFAVGDVIGFPSLASTGMDQGRIAVAHMFKTEDLDHIATVLPYGIYTVPEVSTVGVSEEKALKDKLNYCVGRARYCDMPRGKIMGVEDGFLKLIFDQENMTILGVHIIGNMAAEIIHYGLTLVEDKKTLMHVISSVFNYPTLHDLYKYACYDGLSNLSGHKIKK